MIPKNAVQSAADAANAASQPQPQETVMRVMRQPPDPATFARMNSTELREAFLVEGLFAPGRIKLAYSHVDRAVIGAAVPGRDSLMLPAGRELGAEYFTQRRELGVINIGGAGAVRVDGQEICLAHKEALYVGRGNREIRFCSADPAEPAQFYLVSYTAHAAHPCVKIGREQAGSTELGSTTAANRRTIHKLIIPGRVATCQLAMGCTELAEGSVWNTMPAHTHGRRSEIYLYFDLPGDAMVVHCMGRPNETRHLLVRNRQTVVSPDWSVHFGAGTTNYSFIWAMGGENQEFSDMDLVPMEMLL